MERLKEAFGEPEIRTKEVLSVYWSDESDRFEWAESQVTGFFLNIQPEGWQLITHSEVGEQLWPPIQKAGKIEKGDGPRLVSLAVSYWSFDAPFDAVAFQVRKFTDLAVDGGAVATMGMTSPTSEDFATVTMAVVTSVTHVPWEIAV